MASHPERLTRKLSFCVYQTVKATPEQRPVYWRKRNAIRVALDKITPVSK